MSKYFNSTMTYIKNNWISVLLHIIVPSILYTIFILPTSSFDYIVKNISTLDVKNAMDIFITINDGSRFSSWEYIVFYVLTAVLTIVVFGSYIGNIQNKMRYGKTIYGGFKGVFKRVNETLFAAVRAGILLMAAMELYALIMSVVIFCVIKVTAVEWLRIFWVSLIGAAFIVLMFYGCGWIACALPNMTMRNEGMFRSIGRSMKMVGDKQIKVFGAFIVPLIISYIPLLVCSACDIFYDHIVLTIVKYIVIFAFYVFSFAYYVVLMYVVFFDINEIEREDLNMENKWRL